MTRQEAPRWCGRGCSSLRLRCDPGGASRAWKWVRGRRGPLVSPLTRTRHRKHGFLFPGLWGAAQQWPGGAGPDAAEPEPTRGAKHCPRGDPGLELRLGGQTSGMVSAPSPLRSVPLEAPQGQGPGAAATPTPVRSRGRGSAGGSSPQGVSSRGSHT